MVAETGLIEWFLSQRGKHVFGYARAIYSGFTTAVLAGLIGDLLERFRTLHGVWHVSSEPISKFELLHLVNRVMRLGITIQRDETFVCDRSLNSERFRRATGFTPPSWQAMIQQMTDDPTPYDAVRQTWS